MIQIGHYSVGNKEPLKDVRGQIRGQIHKRRWVLRKGILIGADNGIKRAGVDE